MPNAGLKEKSKRTTTRSPFENSTPKVGPEDSDVEMDDETSSDEEDVPEKDEAEKKLERMLFGDDEGFMGALKNQQDREAGMALTLNSDDSDAGEDFEEVEAQDLAGMADSDVCDPNSVLLSVSSSRSNISHPI
jgi:U3 small nucleolar RNA-associated protein 18